MNEVALYESGLSIEQVAKHFGITRQGMYYRLKGKTKLRDTQDMRVRLRTNHLIKRGYSKEEARRKAVNELMT